MKIECRSSGIEISENDYTIFQVGGDVFCSWMQCFKYTNRIHALLVDTDAAEVLGLWPAERHTL